MTIQTTLTHDDYRALSRYAARLQVRAHKLKRWLIAIGAAAVVGLALRFVFALTSRELDPFSLMLGGLGMICWFLIIARFRAFRLGPAPDGLLLEPRTVSLEQDGIRSTSARHETLYRWPALREVAVTQTHLFLMVDANAGVILPRRVFTSTAEFDGFVEAVRRKGAAPTA